MENVNNNEDEANVIKRAIYYALNTFQNDKTKATSFIKKLLREKTYGEIKNKKMPFSDLDFISPHYPRECQVFAYIHTYINSYNNIL